MCNSYDINNLIVTFKQEIKDQLYYHMNTQTNIQRQIEAKSMKLHSKLIIIGEGCINDQLKLSFYQVKYLAFIKEATDSMMIM